MKYLPSALAGKFSKSAGSTTASHNRYGAYMRTRVTPVNPKTTKQLTQRSQLASLSATWRTLTDAQRAAWKALGAQMTRTDSLGATYDLTGLQAFISCNRNILFTGGTVLLAAPALVSATAITSVTVTATSA